MLESDDSEEIEIAVQQVEVQCNEVASDGVGPDLVEEESLTGLAHTTLHTSAVRMTEDEQMVPSARRLPIVGVMGSGSTPHEELAKSLGQWLAALDVHLLTGGGGGVMSAVSQAFCEVRDRKGKIIGVLPGNVEDGHHESFAGYPNPWVEIPIQTHLPLSGQRGTDLASRNHINVLTSDVLIALPGSFGTSSEVKLALAYGKPVVALLDSEEDIPDLPGEVQVESSLDGVKRFVLAHINKAADSERLT